MPSRELIEQAFGIVRSEAPYTLLTQEMRDARIFLIPENITRSWQGNNLHVSIRVGHNEVIDDEGRPAKLRPHKSAAIIGQRFITRLDEEAKAVEQGFQRDLGSVAVPIRAGTLTANGEKDGAFYYTTYEMNIPRRNFSGESLRRIVEENTLGQSVKEALNVLLAHQTPKESMRDNGRAPIHFAFDRWDDAERAINELHVLLRKHHIPNADEIVPLLPETLESLRHPDRTKSRITIHVCDHLDALRALNLELQEKLKNRNGVQSETADKICVELLGLMSAFGLKTEETPTHPAVKITEDGRATIYVRLPPADDHEAYHARMEQFKARLTTTFSEDMTISNGHAKITLTPASGVSQEQVATSLHHLREQIITEYQPQLLSALNRLCLACGLSVRGEPTANKDDYSIRVRKLQSREKALLQAAAVRHSKRMEGRFSFQEEGNDSILTVSRRHVMGSGRSLKADALGYEEMIAALEEMTKHAKSLTSGSRGIGGNDDRSKTEGEAT